MQTNIEAQIPDAAAIQEATASSIEDNNRAMIGYCTVDGSIANADSPSECSALGGEWLAAEPLAETVKGLQIVDNNGDSANVEQRMRSYRDELGKLNSEYTVKVQTDVDGKKYVGGFGLSTDSETQTIEAGFDVDRFWVGKLDANDRFQDGAAPFIIENGEVFMKEAVMGKLTFDKLKSANGDFIVEDGKLQADFIDVNNMNIAGQSTFSGELDVTASGAGGYITIKGDRIEVWQGTKLRMRMGRL
jgi:predicted phage tail protein